MPTLRCTLFLALLPATLASAADPDPLLHWLDNIAQKQLDHRDSQIRAISNKKDAEIRQSYVRAKILELIGGLPDYNGPLNPQITGALRLPGIVIEKIVFESLPRAFVTANLYRPDKEGKFPGILLPLGHWGYGKPAVQQIASNLALKGFVVLTYDPWGQGERQQIYDARYGGSLANQGTEQHLLAGGLSILVGQSFARYRIWDAKRALDYLVSRPEVIIDKIGCTGCSGGGTITTYISALDPRIKVAAPACYINSFRLIFSGPLGDSEQSVPGFLAAGLDIPDYVELFAPKPWLISSTREDFFPLAGARIAFEEAQRWYGLFGADDRIKWAVGPGGHGTPLEIREAIYAWMIRWLQDGKASAKEQAVPLLPEHALWAAPQGQVANINGSREVFDFIREDHRVHFRQGSRPELLASLSKLIDPPRQAPKVRVEVDRLRFESEPGWEIACTLLPAAHIESGGAVLIVDTRGEVPERARELAAAGNTVLVLSPRGFPTTANIRAYSGDWLPNVRALLIGRSLPAMRAHDILNGIQILKSQPHVDPMKIRAEASGVAGIWLLMAAAVEPAIASASIERTPHSFTPAFDNPLTRDLHSAILPGFALRWDLADLVEPQRLIWTDPTDWLGHIVSLKGHFSYTPAAQ